MEIDLPKSVDSGVVARVKRMHFYCVREEFLTVWKQHEQFLHEYEERLKRAVQRQARIGKFIQFLWPFENRTNKLCSKVNLIKKNKNKNCSRYSYHRRRNRRTHSK